MTDDTKAAGMQTLVMVLANKTVKPPNIMDAIKRITEIIVTRLNEEDQTNSVAVRFGNVIRSFTRMILVFKDQSKKD